MNLRTTITLLLLVTNQLAWSHPATPGKSTIILQVAAPAATTADSVTIMYMPVDYISGRPQFERATADIKDGTASWSIPSKTALLIRIPWQKKGYYFYYFEPGDSIHVDAGGNTLAFSGNARPKFELLHQMAHLPEYLSVPSNPLYYKTLSLQDYVEWSTFLNRKKEWIQQLIKSYDGKMSASAKQYIHTDVLAGIERERITKFYALLDLYAQKHKNVMELLPVYDSTIINPTTTWLNSLPSGTDKHGYYYGFARLHLKRTRNFVSFPTEESTPGNDLARNLEYITHGKRIYKGDILNNYITQVLTEEIIRKHLFDDGVKKLLDDYYDSSIPDRYKQYTRKFEGERRKRKIGMNEKAPKLDYDAGNGKKIAYHGADGRIHLFTFLQEDDAASATMAAEIGRITKTPGQYPGVVMHNMLVGRTGSQALPAKPSPAFEGITHLWISPDAGILKEFHADQLPAYTIIDGSGKFASTSLQTGRADTLSLTEAISLEIALLNDGPYVNAATKGYTAVTIRQGEPDTRYFPSTASPVLAVQTDRHDQYFNVALRPQATPPACNYPEVKKVFTVSDIEGNFLQFRKLLMANNIIDEAYKWTFGNGHLVLLGDFFDRGRQVTECLWLIYMLEGEAAKQGGQVHFILGNHELMNLSGDLRYVQRKYLQNAQKAGQSYSQLYGSSSVLGQWLRTKNIIENVGGTLFVHGGISETINKSGKSLEELNNLARPGYALPRDSANGKLPMADTLLFSNDSPCWYRGYYSEKDAASHGQVQETLRTFNARRIVTGHTVLGNIITTHYNGTVINIDTRHKYGYSEALMIDGQNCYRTNTTGSKSLLDTRIPGGDGHGE